MTTSFKHLDLADLPALKQDSLCRMLDKNNHWLDLGQRMQFNSSDLESIKTESLRLRKSATDLLINKWTIYGHNVTELFKLLADMQHFVAMHEIKDLVDKRYHIWLKAVPATVMGPTQVIGEPAVVLNGTSRADSTQEDEQENIKDKLNIPEVSIKDLEDATNQWAEENVLGKGGYGVVYRGELWATRVAIKKSEFRGTRSVKDNLLQSVNELRHLNHCRHDNILPIYGFAFQDDTLFMVTQLMLGGSLEDKLPRDRENLREGFVPLTWKQRWTIAQGTARGLHYLHRYNAKPLVHGDIKPGNILLDLSFEPKIADFGFSREGFFNDECHQISRAFGTRPYAAPEFIRMKSFSAKNDVFSFGVVLFELATALSPLNGQRPCPFLFELMAEVDENLKPNIMEVIDHSMGNDETCFNFCKMLISLGKNCTDSIPNRRPEMIEVLEGLKGFQPTPVTPPAVSEIDSAIFDSDDSSC